jgi:hypothetical protein
VPRALTDVRLREIETWLMRAAAAGLVACALAALYAALAWTSWPAARFLLFYVAPMVIAVPWWLRERLRPVSGPHLFLVMNNV